MQQLCTLTLPKLLSEWSPSVSSVHEYYSFPTSPTQDSCLPRLRPPEHAHCQQASGDAGRHPYKGKAPYLQETDCHLRWGHLRWRQEALRTVWGTREKPMWSMLAALKFFETFLIRIDLKRQNFCVVLKQMNLFPVISSEHLWEKIALKLMMTKHEESWKFKRSAYLLRIYQEAIRKGLAHMHGCAAL